MSQRSSDTSSSNSRLAKKGMTIKLSPRQSRLLRDDTSPLSVFLVKSGSAGDRLLFRYPFETLSPPLNDGHSPKNKDNPFIPDSSMITSSTTEGDEDHPYVKPSSSDIEPHIQTVVKLSNKVLSDLFAVKPSLCDQKFEVKINDVRFVGHPISLGGNKDTDRDLLTVNIVFALKANASHDIVNCYHQCSQRMSIGLQEEEDRMSYLNHETMLMMSFHDEESGTCDFGEIVKKSLLANTLVKVFEDLSEFGATHFTINKWMSVSFCLPQKVHRLALRHHEGLPSIGPQRILKCLEHLRPYHGLLLISSVDELHSSLPQDASPALFRVIHRITPVKNLLELSADADITLTQVFHVVAQLLYWGKATVIYPLCENNKYTVHPLAPTSVHSNLVQDFGKDFPKENLVSLLSVFSDGITLKELLKLSGNKKKTIAQVIWLLKHRLLLQIHCYVHFIPPEMEKKQVESSNFISSSNISAIDSVMTEGREQPSYTAQDIHVVVSQTKDQRDRQLFERLATNKYFDGKRHLEDVMYYEDVQRNELTSLIDKFSDVLFSCEHDDTAITQLCPYNQYS